jgi:LysM repeat protein
MKFKLILFFCFFLLKFNQSNALSEALPDSGKYKWIKGEKFLLHTVQPKETWNSISQRYNLRISELMNANLGVIDLKIGQVLNIPAAGKLEASNKKEKEVPQISNPLPTNKNVIEYVVKAGETLFSISKRFGSTVDEVKKWNHLPNNTVQLGQKLIVGYITPPEKPEPKKEIKPEPATATVNDKLVEKKSDKVLQEKTAAADGTGADEVVIANKGKVEGLPEKARPEKPLDVTPADSRELKAINPENKPDVDDNPTRSMIPVGKGVGGKTIVQVSESGVCSWINDAEVNQNKYYGLHRSAPIGTIVKVTNKMNDRYVFVKIVGVLPDTGENEKSIIKISQAAVSKIGALDAHFQVELSYGVTQ